MSIDASPKKFSELGKEDRLATLVALRGYTCYTARIAPQPGTVPLVFVLENTHGRVTPEYISPGDYLLHFNPRLSSNNTIILTNSTPGVHLSVTSGELGIYCTVDGVLSDMAGDFYISVQVYKDFDGTT